MLDTYLLRFFFAGLLCAMVTPRLEAVSPPSSQIGRAAVDFTLPNLYGKEISLADYADKKVLVVTFLGVECPLAKLYGKRLQQLSETYAERGVAFVAIDSNQQDSLTELAAFGKRLGITFQLLKDNRAEVATLFGATRTPEVFVLDAERQIQYHGRIDDQYGIGYVRDAPEQTFACDAIDAILDGKPVAIPATDAVGCVIGRPREANEASPVTYSKQVARILQKNCLECHRDGEIAPFAMSDYDEVAGWAETIAEVIQDQRMPPWHADPQHGHYQGERLMSEADKQLVYEWVKQGAPQGDPADLPKPPEYLAGWRLPREPDLVVAMRSKPFEVPAEGVIEYQYFAADPHLKEDTWIQAADIVPGARGAVHHVIVFISPPAEQARRGLGWLGAYVPGQGSMELPPGQARLVPAGSKFIFQMHYTPTGSVEKDLTKMGLVFADPETVREEVISLYAANGRFEIPPHDSNYRVDAKLNYFPPGSRLLGMGPHMHSRGKSFRFTGVWPDGSKKILLDVPQYDFNWQHNYRLIEPITPEPGFAIECSAHFDNSKSNLVNPDPSASVRWGDQTFEEMMIAFFEVAVPRGTRFDEGDAEHLAPERVQKAQAVADQLFTRFDRDKDGVLDRGELPRSFALFAFSRYDRDGDKTITNEEVFEAALERLSNRG